MNTFNNFGRDINITLSNLTNYEDREAFGALLYVNATRSVNITRDYWFMIPQDDNVPMDIMIHGMEYTI